MTNGDREGTGGEGFATEVGEETGEFFLVEIVEFGADLFARVHDILAEEVLWDHL